MSGATRKKKNLTKIAETLLAAFLASSITRL
jgi:hypothetical protein